MRIPDAARRLNYYPHQLSGGMRQRVMIAMALACNPRLLIADEPTTALDVTVQAQIMALLAELKRETGMSMIFITHDIGLVAGIADKIMVMQNGAAVEQGELNQMLDNPQHDYTKHLLQRRAAFHRRPRGAQRRPARAATAEPVVKVDDLVVRFPASRAAVSPRRPAPCMRSTASISIWCPAKRWPSSAKAARANRPPRAPSSGWCGRRAARSMASAERRADARPVQMVFQDPYRLAQSAAQRREPAGRTGDRRRRSASMPKLRERMAILLKRVGLPEDASTAIRTSSPAASGSASASRGR